MSILKIAGGDACRQKEKKVLRNMLVTIFAVLALTGWAAREAKADELERVLRPVYRQRERIIYTAPAREWIARVGSWTGNTAATDAINHAIIRSNPGDSAGYGWVGPAVAIGGAAAVAIMVSRRGGGGGRGKSLGGPAAGGYREGEYSLLNPTPYPVDVYRVGKKGKEKFSFRLNPGQTGWVKGPKADSREGYVGYALIPIRGGGFTQTRLIPEPIAGGGQVGWVFVPPPEVR